jgi:hypothetical protein
MPSKHDVSADMDAAGHGKRYIYGATNRLVVMACGEDLAELRNCLQQ